MDRFIFTLGNFSLWAAAIAGLVFVVFYHFSAAWWSSEFGWHIMTWTASTELIFVYLAYASIVRDDYARLPEPRLLWFRLVVYTTFFALIVWRIILVGKAQRRRDSGRRKVNEPALSADVAPMPAADVESLPPDAIPLRKDQP